MHSYNHEDRIKSRPTERCCTLSFEMTGMAYDCLPENRKIMGDLLLRILGLCFLLYLWIAFFVPLEAGSYLAVVISQLF